MSVHAAQILMIEYLKFQSISKSTICRSIPLNRTLNVQRIVPDLSKDRMACNLMPYLLALGRIWI